MYFVIIGIPKYAIYNCTITGVPRISEMYTPAICFNTGIFLVLIGLGAGFVQRVSGFGLCIFAMVFLPHFMPSHTAAAAISGIFSCVLTAYNAFCYRKQIAYKVAWPMICASLVSIPIAVHFSAAVSAHIFKILLGCVLVVLSVYFIFFNKNVKFKPTVAGGILAGVLGGGLGGLFSTGGPPIVLYLNNAISENMVYFATISFYFAFTDVYATGVRVINGIITPEILLYAAIGLVGCLTGDYIGKKVFDKLDADKLKKIIYIGMIISGIVMFF